MRRSASASASRSATYMHPAAGIAQFFQARSYGEIGRKQALGGHVALSADGLILKIRKAQAEARAATASLRRLRDEARRDELAIAHERAAAAAAQQRTQQLLRRANLGALEAARQRRIDGAGELAASLIRFPGPVRASAAAAVRAAASQIGKPYRWGAAGPDSYDCSGLTMWAWARAGVCCRTRRARNTRRSRRSRCPSSRRGTSCSAGTRSTTSGSTRAAAS